MENIKTCAVIITYNPDLIMLSKEYYSIINQVEYIYYVDNNSKDKISLSEWAKDKKKSSFIWLDKNEGIGVAQNHGIKTSIKNGATHIVFFDQDSVIEEGFVSGLMKTEQLALSKGVKVGLTGPIYRSFDDDFLYPIRTLSNNRMKIIPYDGFDVYTEVSHLIASGTLLRKCVIDEVGLLNESLFIGYIDFEYCFRAYEKGYSHIITKNACMKHMMGDRQIKLFGRKIGIYSPFRRYFDCRNTLLIRKQKLLPLTICNYYLRLLIGKMLISYLLGPNRLEQIRYTLKGLYDGFKGISGNCSIK